MTNLFDSNQEKSLINIMTERQKSDLRQSILEKLVEKKAQAKQAPLTEQTSAPQQKPLKGTEKYAQVLREQVRKDTSNRRKVIPEKTDLLAGDESVTSAQLRQSNQELWNRVQTSLASVGGGGGDTRRLLIKDGDTMEGKLVIGPYAGDSDRAFIEFDVGDVDSNLSLEVKQRDKYINMSHWTLHSDNGKPWADEREWSGIAYGQGKFIASQYMAWWRHPDSSNAQGISEDGENWRVDDKKIEGGRWFDAGGIHYNSELDLWVQCGGLGGDDENVSILWSETGDSWNAVLNPEGVSYNDILYFRNLAYSPELGKYVGVSEYPNWPQYNRWQKKRVISSTDGMNWQWDSLGSLAMDSDFTAKETAWGQSKFITVGNGNTPFIQSSDGLTWEFQDTSHAQTDSYPNSTHWKGIKFVEEKSIWVTACDDDLVADPGKSPCMWSDDGTTWNYGTFHFQDRYSKYVTLGGEVIYGDGKFILTTQGIRHWNASEKGEAIVPTIFWSVDGKNWFPNELQRFGDVRNVWWEDAVHAKDKFVAVSSNDDTMEKIATLPHNSKKNSLFVDDALVATQDNLTPLFKKVNQLSSRMNVIYSDSNPFDRDSYAGNYIAPGQMWFDASTDAGQLMIRHNDSWVAV